MHTCLCYCLNVCESLYVCTFLCMLRNKGTPVCKQMYAKLMLRSCLHARSSDSPGQLLGVPAMRVVEGTSASVW